MVRVPRLPAAALIFPSFLAQSGSIAPLTSAPLPLGAIMKPSPKSIGADDSELQFFDLDSELPEGVDPLGPGAGPANAAESRKADADFFNAFEDDFDESDMKTAPQ